MSLKVGQKMKVIHKRSGLSKRLQNTIVSVVDVGISCGDFWAVKVCHLNKSVPNYDYLWSDELEPVRMLTRRRV